MDKAERLQFHRAVIDDLERVLRLQREYYTFDHIPFEEATARSALAALLADASLGAVWLLESVEGGLAIGFVIYTYGFDVEMGGRQATVTDLYLVEGHRRRGLGTEALAFVEQTLATQGLGVVELQVERDNQAARAFYARLGYVAHDRIPLAKPLRSSTAPAAAAAAQSGALRSARPGERAALLSIAVATGLFTPAEAEALLGGILSRLWSGTLGPQHRVEVWADPSDDRPIGWTYAAADEHADGVWELWWLGVLPERHGSGVGADLLRSTEAHAAAAGARLQQVATSALPPLGRARAFYERHGYRSSGRIPNFYGRGDDKLIYVKPL